MGLGERNEGSGDGEQVFLKRNKGNRNGDLKRGRVKRVCVWCPYSQPGPQHELTVKVSGVIVL